MTGHTPTHRSTLFLEQAFVERVDAHPGGQHIVRLRSPQCARHAHPGSFIHLRCDDAIPMRRPLSIMRANAAKGWVEVLFKVVGPGLSALANKSPGDAVSSLGPIGRGFSPQPDRPRIVLIGGGVGIPPMIFMAERLAAEPIVWQPIVLMGSELPFPFTLNEATAPLNWLPEDGYRSVALLDEWGITCRLASLEPLPGTYRGYVPELAEELVARLSVSDRARTQLMACGPTPMLAATAALARRYGVPCQVSLEEYMACAVGGCAGCTVEVTTDRGVQMRRVCVDGPVFDALEVFPESGVSLEGPVATP